MALPPDTVISPGTLFTPDGLYSIPGRASPVLDVILAYARTTSLGVAARVTNGTVPARTTSFGVPVRATNGTLPTRTTAVTE